MAESLIFNDTLTGHIGTAWLVTMIQDELRRFDMYYRHTC